MKKLAIVSGKGGTGKSSITAAFISIAKNVIAIDCDVDAANLYLIYDCGDDNKLTYKSGQGAIVNQEKCIRCGLCVDKCAYDAMSISEDGAFADPIACEGCALCSNICPVNAISMVASGNSVIKSGPIKYGYMFYGRLAPGEENSGKFITKLRSLADDYANKSDYAVEIMDGPPGVGCPVISTLSGVDKIVIVTEPTMSGLSDLKRILELSKSYSKEVYVIINKFDLNHEYCDKIEVFCKKKNIPILSKLPFDRKMVDAVINKQSIVEYEPHGFFAVELTKAYNKIFE